MGRKPLNKTRKHNVLKVRLNDDELATITKKATAAGQDTSTWVRDLSLAAPAPRKRKVTVRTDPAH